MPVTEAAHLALIASLDALIEADRLTKKERALRPVVARLEKELGTAFRIQGREFMKEFVKLRPRIQEADDTAVRFVPRDWLIVFAAIVEATFENILRPLELRGRQALLIGGQQFIASIGISNLVFGLDNPRAIAYLEQFAASKVTRINETTRSQLQTLITASAEDGWSYDRLARKIRDRFEGFAIGKPQQHIQSRSHLVAVTEVGNAYEEAAHIAAHDLQEGKLQMEKSWSTTGDNRVSDGCRANEAEGWIPLGRPHASGHQKPLRFPGCRCAELYRRKAV
ncbi:MAG: hypothetical protein DWQ07_15400 [Chloroflexi bacterium]|nr:MAG: hypothetical protein DWQ07_15400 [Chloroflexota bacterium]